jgi:hypothetical protein
MTPLVLARSAFSIPCVRAGALSTGTAAAARIFRRILIAELDGFLCFWHFFLVSSLLVFRFFQLRPTQQVDANRGWFGQPIFGICLVVRSITLAFFYHHLCHPNFNRKVAIRIFVND